MGISATDSISEPPLKRHWIHAYSLGNDRPLSPSQYPTPLEKSNGFPFTSTRPRTSWRMLHTPCRHSMKGTSTPFSRLVHRRYQRQRLRHGLTFKIPSIEKILHDSLPPRPHGRYAIRNGHVSKNLCLFFPWMVQIIRHDSLQRDL